MHACSSILIVDEMTVKTEPGDSDGDAGIRNEQREGTGKNIAQNSSQNSDFVLNKLTPSFILN